MATSSYGRDDYKQNAKIIAKAWADPVFKERFLRETNAVLEEYGIEVPPGVTVRVSEETTSVRYVVLPAKPRWFNEEEPIDLPPPPTYFKLDETERGSRDGGGDSNGGGKKGGGKKGGGKKGGAKKGGGRKR